jgi:hypothetical protein
MVGANPMPGKRRGWVKDSDTNCFGRGKAHDRLSFRINYALKILIAFETSESLPLQLQSIGSGW